MAALHIATEEYFESLEELEQHLPDDRELMVLKGHLLIEHLLDKYLYMNLSRPSKLKKSRFAFAQKISIVSAMHHDTSCDWLWSSVGKFNKLRNELSHKLDGEKFEELRTDFLASVEAFPESEVDEYEVAVFPDSECELKAAICRLQESLSRRVNL